MAMLPHAVILTRPLAQATVQAQVLAQALGAVRQIVLFPCMEIHDLDDYSALDQALKSLSGSGYAMLAFVSPNAIDITLRRLQVLGLELPVGLQIAVMGAGSRHRLQEYGIDNDRYRIISPVDLERTDSETLLQVLDLPALTGQPVLIIRGQHGRELLADALRQHGVKVEQIAAYRRAAPVFDAEKQQTLRELLESQGDWVISSSEILSTLLLWVQKLDQAGHLLSQSNNQLTTEWVRSPSVVKMQQQHLIVPHRRIAENARNLGFQSITLTGSGDERLLVALQSRL